MQIKGKLELTWVGKYEDVRLEPRILVEDKEKSYGDTDTDNKLIHGDNLLALKALENEYSGKIKCVYIDPPFNTGARINSDGKEVGYEDGIEHSIWINMMKQRLEIIYKLLDDEQGVIFVHLDDNEVDYCKILLDEIFKRQNFINRITVESRSPSAFSTVNPGVFKASEYILWYAKDKSKWTSRSMRIPANRDTAYNKFIVNINEDEDKWEFIPLKRAFLECLNSDRTEVIKEFLKECYEDLQGKMPKEICEYIEEKFALSILVKSKQLASYLRGKLKCATYEEFYNSCYPYMLEKCTYMYDQKDVDNFVYNNANSVVRETEIDDEGAGADIVELKKKSIKNKDKVLKLEREKYDDVYVRNGKQISFYEKNVLEIDGKITATKLLTNVWEDISWEGIAKEGGIVFKKGKKPEKLLKRIIELTTDEGDFVMDSFLGSGTTVAVAHKMRRKWIGIEMAEHCYSHCANRLRAVIEGEQSGISKIVKWQGGGGFKFYELAESLLVKNKVLPVYQLNPNYTFEMIAEAICKIEGFKYEQLGEFHGKSSENRFIHVTLEFVNSKYIMSLTKNLGEKQSLLIYCTKMQSDMNLPDNVEVKKIPRDLLEKCSFESEVQ